MTWKFIDLTTRKEGAKALSAEIHIADMLTKGDPFPADVRRRATAQAQRMSNALQELGIRDHLIDDQIIGSRLDPAKRHRVGVAMRKGEVDVNELRPYQRYDDMPQMPRVALVASAGNAELHADPDYVRRVAECTIALAWACEAAGVDVWAALVANHSQLHSRQRYKRAHIAYWLAQPGRVTPLTALATTMGRNRFLWEGFPAVWEVDAQARERFAALQGRKSLYWGDAYFSYDGGNGMTWADERLDADIVIGLGRLQPTHKPNHLLIQSHDYDLNEIMAQVLKQLRNLKK